MFGLASDARSDRDLSSLLLVICALTLVYVALVYAPYRLIDDNWLMRGDDPRDSYPGLGFIAVVQGRPVFAGLIWLSRALAHRIGSEAAMAVLRALGIFGLSIFAWLLHRFTVRQGFPRPASLAIAIGAATLPAFQVYVAAGPWLTLPLAVSAAAVVILSRDQTAWRACTAVALFALSLATYQATPFIAIPLVMLILLDRPMVRDALRTTVWIGGSLLVALAIYYVLWRLAYHIGFGTAQMRYNPTALIDDPLTRASQFWSSRVPQAFKLWGISADRHGRSYVPLVSAAVIAIGIVAHGWALRTKRGRAWAVKQTASVVALFCAAFVASDIATLISPTLILSYTTIVGASLCVYFAFCWSLVVIARTMKLASVAVLVVVCAAGMAMAQMTVVREFVLPLNSEAAKFRLAVRSYIEEHGHQPDRVQIFRRPWRDDDYAAWAEFAWRNLDHEFYAHWFVLNQFADMDLNADVEVVVLNDTGKDRTVYPAQRVLPPGDVLIYDAERGTGPDRPR
jgi:hypothetical protein